MDGEDLGWLGGHVRRNGFLRMCSQSVGRSSRAASQSAIDYAMQFKLKNTANL